MATREPIYSALWQIVSFDPRIAAVFATTSRSTRHFEDVSAEEMPALFMLQKRETWQRPGKGISPKRTLMAHFLCYQYNAAPNQNFNATGINALMDVIDDVLTTVNNPGNTQTLGGLVEHVYIEGDVEIADALLQEKSIFVVPLTILIP